MQNDLAEILFYILAGKLIFSVDLILVGIDNFGFWIELWYLQFSFTSFATFPLPISHLLCKLTPLYCFLNNLLVPYILQDMERL